MRQFLGTAAVLVLLCGSASAATMAGGPAETGNMMLIGLGLVGAASLTRLRTKRG